MAVNRWLPPARSDGIAPEAIAMPGKNGKWRWKEVKHTPKEESKRRRFFKAMKEADQDDETHFDY